MNNLIKKLTAATATMAMLFGLGIAGSKTAAKVNAATQTATYTISAKDAVTTSGVAPSDSEATYSQTYTTAGQMTSGKSTTLTLAGYDGKVITNITLSMKSNARAGAGTFSAVAGTTTLAEIKTATTFNKFFDSTAYSTSYKDVHVTMDNNAYTIQSGETVTITIAATTNSLYIQTYSIEYDDGGASVTSISASGQTTEYYVDDEFAFDGSVTATFSDGTSSVVDSSSLTVTAPDMSSAGTKEVTISYGGVETSYNINVAERPVITATVTEALAAGNALADNETTAAIYEVTGYVVKKDSWNSSYNNASIYIADSDTETNTENMLQVFRMADKVTYDILCIGSQAKVTSRIIKYVDTSKTVVETLANPTVVALNTGDNIVLYKTMSEIVSENGYTVSSGSTVTCYTSLALDEVVTISTSGNPNCGAFYGSAPIDWRLYQNQNGDLTVTLADGYELVSVMVNYNISSSGVLEGAASGETVAASGSTVTYTVGNTGTATNGQVRVTSISVVYKAATTPTPAEPLVIDAPSEIDFECIDVPFTYSNLPETYVEVFAWAATQASTDIENKYECTETIVDSEDTANPTITTLENKDATFYICAYYIPTGSTEKIYSTPVLVNINYGLSNFTSDMKTGIADNCDPDGEISFLEDIQEYWGILALCWGDLSEAEQTTFRSATADATKPATTIEGAAALYDYVYTKYATQLSLANFASRTVSASAPAIKSAIKEQAAISTIVVVTMVSSITVIGALTLSKKRKEN